MRKLIALPAGKHPASDRLAGYFAGRAAGPTYSTGRAAVGLPVHHSILSAGAPGQQQEITAIPIQNLDFGLDASVADGLLEFIDSCVPLLRDLQRSLAACRGRCDGQKRLPGYGRVSFQRPGM